MKSAAAQEQTDPQRSPKLEPGEANIMLITLAKLIVAAAGVALCGVGVWGFLAPQKLMRWVKNTMDAEWGFWFAMIVRLLLGITLLVAAPTAKFPSALMIIGWIAIAAAIVVVLLGRQRLRQLVQWFLDRFSPPIIRTWLLFAIAFGCFLVYGVS